MLLHEISVNDIAKHKARQLAEGKTLSTTGQEITALHTLLNYFVKHEYLDKNVVVGSGLIDNVDNARVRYLTLGEEKRLLAACDKWLYPIVLCGLHTGFHAKEIALLTWRNVDFHHDTITVEGVYSKNRETESVPLTKTLRDVLLQLKRGYRLDDAVFRQRNGKPYGEWRANPDYS